MRIHPPDRAASIPYDIMYANPRKMTMTSISATEARKKLYRLLDEVYESHQPVHITGKRHSGVLVSE